MQSVLNETKGQFTSYGQELNQANSTAPWSRTGYNSTAEKTKEQSELTERLSHWKVFRCNTDKNIQKMKNLYKTDWQRQLMLDSDKINGSNWLRFPITALKEHYTVCKISFSFAKSTDSAAT